MYTSTTIRTDAPIRAWRIKGDPDLWFGVDDIGMRQATSITPAEAQQLIAELQRELSAVEAEARGVAA
jgi:hypothetical protein